MNKEELETEAIAKYKTGSYPQLHPDYRAFVHGYLAGAEPREKQIAELKKKNLNTQDAVTMQMYTNRANKEMADKQLLEAKEIIKALINIIAEDITVIDTEQKGWDYKQAIDFVKE